MGIKVRKGDIRDLRVTLDKLDVESTRQLRRVHRDGAYAMAQTTREMVPYKKGVLESSVTVHEQRGTRGRKSFSISVSAVNPKTKFNYALWIHEAHYNLGMGSLAKQSSVKHKVGRKYLERALRWVIDDWGLIQRSREAVDRAIQKSKRK